MFGHFAYAQDAGFVAGEIIVKFKPGIIAFPQGSKRLPIASVTSRSPQVSALLQSFGATEIEKVFENTAPGDTVGYHIRTGAPVRIIDLSQIYTIILPASIDIPEAVKRFDNLPEVAYAHPNFIGHVTGSEPNDDPSGQYLLYQASDRDIDAYDPSGTAAWDITTGSSAVKIGIVDTGIEHVLADLGGSIGSGSKVLNGWYASGLSDTRDTNGHGTRIAGIAAALTNNGTGMAGVAGGWGGVSQNMGARLIPLRVGSSGNFNVNTFSTGISKAVEKGADIINMSSAFDNNNTLNETCYNAFAQGAVLVAAMGNDNSSTPKYPAGLGGKDDGGFVIAVGATDSTDNQWPSSNTGNHIDLVAPGADIKSLKLDGTIGTYNGTSYAAPVVSGITALLLSYNANLADQDFKALLSRSADKVPQMSGADWTSQHGWGRVNALKALQLLQSPNTLTHITVSGGLNSQLTWDTHKHTFFSWFGPNDLATAVYWVKQYRVYKNITFPSAYTQPPEVWARIVGTTGWDDSNPNYQEPHIGISSVTNTGCTVETYVYEVWNLSWQYVGFKPAAPQNVTLEITVLGEPGPPPPQPPPAPQNLTITNAGNLGQNVQLGWNASTGATSYKIYRCMTNSVQSCSYQFIGSTTNTSYTDIEVVIRSGSQSNDTFHYYATAVNANGESGQSNTASTIGEQELFKETTEDQRTAALPDEFTLLQNYPNPFNPETEIRYGLLEAGHVELVIFNVMGQPVRMLVSGNQDKGWYRKVWDGRDRQGNQLASGVYLYRIIVRQNDGQNMFTDVKKVSLVR